MIKVSIEMCIVLQQIMEMRLFGFNKGVLDNGSNYMIKINNEIGLVFQQLIEMR